MKSEGILVRVARWGKVVASVVMVTFLAGCSGTPEQQGVTWGALLGAAAGVGAAAAGMDAGSAAAIGAGTAVVTGLIVYAIAKHNATQEQMRIANANAARAFAAMEAREKAAQAQAKKAKTTASSKQTAPKAPVRPKYIAVDTSPDARSKNAAKSVVVYDAQTQRPVEESVYDLKQVPAKNGALALDNRDVQYVGTGAI
jgi:hypothetical protein